MEINEEYINGIKGKFSLEKIESYIKKLSELNVFVIGDTIIDHYLFVTPKGEPLKTQYFQLNTKTRKYMWEEYWQ